MANIVVAMTEREAAIVKELIDWWINSGRNTRQRPAVPFYDVANSDIYVAKVPGGGIAAHTEHTGTGGEVGTGTVTNVSSAECALYQVRQGGDLIVLNGFTQTIFNLSDTAIAGGTWILAVKDTGGTFFAVDTSGGGGGGGSGITAIGIIDSQTKSSDGLVIIGTNLYAQTADNAAPGIVSLNDQVMGYGYKTFARRILAPAGLQTGSGTTLTSGSGVFFSDNGYAAMFSQPGTGPSPGLWGQTFDAGFTVQEQFAFDSAGFRILSNVGSTLAFGIGAAYGIGGTSVGGDVFLGGIIMAFGASSTTNVGGSTSGSADFTQVFVGAKLKKVMIYCNALLGTASYTFPTAFTNTPVVMATTGLATTAVTALSTTAVTVTGTTTTGFLFLEGY